MASSWCKVASDLDSHPKVRKAGRDGREIFLFALRRNASLDLGGIIPSDHLEPWYLADQLMMTESEAVSGLSRAVQAGLLTREGAAYLIPGWDSEWAKRPLTEAERKARQRAKSTISDTGHHDVTAMSGHDRDSPESHGSEERRGEEKKMVSGGSSPEIAASDPPADPEAERRRKNEARVSRIPAEAWSAADTFRALVLEESPTNALSTRKWAGTTGLRLEWADEIRLIVERDKRTWPQVVEMLDWLFHRQPPGRHKYIVQSPGSLRDKWDRIVLNRNNSKQTSFSNGEKPRVVPKL